MLSSYNWTNGNQYDCQADCVRDETKTHKTVKIGTLTALTGAWKLARPAHWLHISLQYNYKYSTFLDQIYRFFSAMRWWFALCAFNFTNDICLEPHVSISHPCYSYCTFNEKHHFRNKSECDFVEIGFFSKNKLKMPFMIRNHWMIKTKYPIQHFSNSVCNAASLHPCEQPVNYYFFYGECRVWAFGLHYFSQKSSFCSRMGYYFTSDDT